MMVEEMMAALLTAIDEIEKRMTDWLWEKNVGTLLLYYMVEEDKEDDGSTEAMALNKGKGSQN